MAVENVQAGIGTRNFRSTAQSQAAGKFGGVEIRPVDVDEIGFQSALEAAIKGTDQASQTRNKPAPRLRTHYAVHSLSLQEIGRQAKVSGDEREVHRNALQFLRRRQLSLKPRLQANWKQAGRSAAMRQYLALQKLQAALAARGAARSRAAIEEAEQDFMAAMAPVKDNPGNAAALAQRFYEALGQDEDLQELLSGFEPETRAALMEELADCALVEEYDPVKRSVHKTYKRDQFAQALAKSLGLQGFRLDDQDAGEFLHEVQGQLAEMEADQDFDAYARGALNIVSAAEDLEREGGDPARFLEDYDDLVHSEASWAEKCSRAAQLYMQDDGRIDLDKLRKKMESCSQAANLDMHSVRRSADPAHLWAAVQSAKLMARLTTAAGLAEQAGAFFKRHFGREVNASQLLRELLERMANPRAPATAFIDLAQRMNLAGDALPSTLKQAADFFRAMHDMYPDEYTRQALLDNVLMAMDEAAQMEDERLAGQGAADDIIPILEPARPSLPDANLAEPWTGFKAR